MTEMAASEGLNLPILWWVWWFVVASVVYTFIGVWFWRTLSRDKPAVAAEGGEPSINPK